MSKTEFVYKTATRRMLDNPIIWDHASVEEFELLLSIWDQQEAFNEQE